MLCSEYAEWLKEIVEIRKKIERKELLEVSGQLVDDWLNKAEKFVSEMYALLSAIENSKKEKIIHASMRLCTRLLKVPWKI